MRGYKMLDLLSPQVDGKNKELAQSLSKIDNLGQDYDVNWSIDDYGKPSWLKFKAKGTSLKEEAVGPKYHLSINCPHNTVEAFKIIAEELINAGVQVFKIAPPEGSNYATGKEVTIYDININKRKLDSAFTNI